jgi:hypothetical protein
MTYIICNNKKQNDHLNALRAMIDEAEASGISSRNIDEIFAEARTTAKRLGLMNMRADENPL